MAEIKDKAPKNVKLWQKIIAVPSIVLFFFLWATDRQIHLLLPHTKHPSFKDWLVDPSSFKLTLARIIIFAIPIIIFKIVF